MARRARRVSEVTGPGFDVGVAVVAGGLPMGELRDAAGDAVRFAVD